MGLEKALETDCDIINMSFGGAITDEEALSVLKSYIDKAEEKGIIVVAAVGNCGHTDNNICPVRTAFFTRNNRTLEGHMHKIGYEYRIVI